MIPSIITVVLLALGAIGQEHFNREVPYPSMEEGLTMLIRWGFIIFVIGGTWLIWALAK